MLMSEETFLEFRGALLTIEGGEGIGSLLVLPYPRQQDQPWFYRGL